MKILAFCAHPDDAEINCAGTLAKYIKRNDEVHIVNACRGDKGDYYKTPEEMGEIRLTESQKAGKIIGAKVSSLNFGDAELEINHKNLETFVIKIREVNPDIIITHTPDDYHIDHVAVSKLVIDASFLVSVPHYCVKHKVMEHVPQVYFMEPYIGLSFVPKEFVDITDTVDLKLKMLSCHKSQVEWLKSHDHMDILDYVKTSGRYRGYQCGVQYAEGFQRLITALRSVPGNFLP